jgi:hypothetical protein
MPILPDDDPVPVMGLVPQLAEPAAVTAPVPPFSRLFDAAMRRENLVGSAAEALTQPARAPFDPSFDPFDKIVGYEDHARAFLDANSEDDIAATKLRIDDERRRAALLDSGGVMGLLATGAATLLDPTTVIPVGGQFMAVTRSGRALAGAARFGAAGAAGTAVQEVGLQATQVTRPWSESAVNVAAATVIGGALGGAVGALSRSVTRGFEEFSSRVMRESEIYGRELEAIERGYVSEGGSIGAAAVRDTTLEQETLQGALGAERALAQTAPNLRPMFSPSVESRRLIQEVAEQPVGLRKHEEGIPSPRAVETDLRQANAPLAEALSGFDDLFVRYRTGEDRGVGGVARIAVGDVVRDRAGKFSYDEFAEEVGRAMRRDDQHAVPEVAQAAKLMRDRVFDPWKERAIKAGLLDEDVSTDTALSYFMRVYNNEKIIARRDDFSQRIVRWLADEQAKKDAIRQQAAPLVEEMQKINLRLSSKLAKPEETARLSEIQSELEKLVGSWEGKTSGAAKGALKRRTEEEAGRDPSAPRLTGADKPVVEAAEAIAKANTRLEEIELKDISRQIIDRILSTPVGRLPYDIETPSPRGRPSDGPPPRGPLAHRAFKIPDEIIEDYLESDVRVISRIYSRTMAADVTLTEKFGRTDMEDQFQRILADYETLRQGKSEAELKKLDAQMRADLRDIAAVRDRLRGTYGMPDNPNGLANRAFHVVRDLNYLRLLGGMTIAAFSDVGRAVMVHGIARVARDGLVPMLSNFRQFRLAAREAQLAGTALDMVLDTRAMAMADMLDDYGRWSKYERGIQAMSRKFGLVTLMAPWNSAMKQFAGVVSQTRTLQSIERMASGQGIPQAELIRLSRLTIGQEEAERIAAMFQAHGQKSDGVWWANTAAWEDGAAADAFRGALAKEVDEIIVTPSMERPLIMSGAWGNTGRLLFQFKGFAISSTQRVLLSGLQRRDMATLNGALMMSGLGMLSYLVRHQLNADPNKRDLPDPTTADGLAQWLREGVDRSGLTGWLFDAHNTVEKATGGAIGLQRFIGEAPTSRYASRGVLGAVAGPMGGLIEDAGRVAREAAMGEPTEGGISAARRMVPLQNTIGFRHLFDAAEEGIHRSVGTR